ncbi:MAG: DUF433 domain-containing protein [Solimonas sp.]
MATRTVDISTLIGSRPGVYGGRLLLLRSGFPMIQLVADYQSGMRVDDFKEAYPHIDEESLYAGIAYYLANRQALDEELEEREREGEAFYRTWLAAKKTAP